MYCMYQCMHGGILLILSERYPKPLVFLSPLYCVGRGEEIRYKLLVALVHHASEGRRRALLCHRLLGTASGTASKGPHSVSSPDD